MTPGSTPYLVVSAVSVQSSVMAPALATERNANFTTRTNVTSQGVGIVLSERDVEAINKFTIVGTGGAVNKSEESPVAFNGSDDDLVDEFQGAPVACIHCEEINSSERVQCFKCGKYLTQYTY